MSHQIDLFCVVFAVMAHEPRGAPNGGYARAFIPAWFTIRDLITELMILIAPWQCLRRAASAACNGWDPMG